MSLESSREAVLAATEQLDDVPIFVPSNVAVHIDFGPHGEAVHLGPEGSFEALIANTDIYFHEDLGWDSFATRIFNRISKGDLKTRQKMDRILTEMEGSGDFTRRVARALYNTHVSVDGIDLGKDNPLFEQVRELMPVDDGVEVPDDFDISDLSDITQEGVVAGWVSGTKDWATAVNYRDKLMATRFGPVVSGIIAATPRLQRKERLSVLMRLGGMHRQVYTQLREAHAHPEMVTTSSRLGEPVLSEFQYALRAHSLGVELSDETLTRLALRGIFSQTTAEPTALLFPKQWGRLHYYDRIRAQLRVSDKLTNEELWAILDISHPTDKTEEAKFKAFGLVSRHIGRKSIRRA